MLRGDAPVFKPKASKGVRGNYYRDQQVATAPVSVGSSKRVEARVKARVEAREVTLELWLPTGSTIPVGSPRGLGGRRP